MTSTADEAKDEREARLLLAALQELRAMRYGRLVIEVREGRVCQIETTRRVRPGEDGA